MPPKPEPGNYAEAPNIYVKRFETRFTPLPDVSGKWIKMGKEVPVQTLQQHLTKQGFKARTEAQGKDAYFGVTNTITMNDGRTATMEFSCQSFEKSGSKDVAALATVNVRSGDQQDTYRFALVTPNGNLEETVEYTVERDNMTVVLANSFWTRFRSCLNGKCGQTCLDAIPACLVVGGWAAFLWCLVTTCGSCVLRCSACAACNCRWWCKWATGCCRG